jgi:hypothetical protein
VASVERRLRQTPGYQQLLEIFEETTVAEGLRRRDLTFGRGLVGVLEQGSTSKDNRIQFNVSLEDDSVITDEMIAATIVHEVLFHAVLNEAAQLARPRAYERTLIERFGLPELPRNGAISDWQHELAAGFLSNVSVDIITDFLAVTDDMTYGVEVVSMSSQEVGRFRDLARSGAPTSLLQRMTSLGETHVFNARQYATALSSGGLDQRFALATETECTAHVVSASQIVNLGGKIHRPAALDVCLR